MPKTITEHLILQMHSKGVAAIDEVLFSEPKSQKTDLSIEVSAFVDSVGWKILVPFFITVMGGLSAQILKRRFLSNSSNENKAQVMKNTGKDITAFSLERKEECILMIHAALKPLGASREQARKVFDLLFEEMQRHEETPIN